MEALAGAFAPRVCQPRAAHHGRRHRSAVHRAGARMTALSKGARDAQAPPPLRLDLDRDPQAPSLARSALAGFCEREELDGEQSSTLALLVSERVSNAVMHSQAPPASGIELCVSRLGDGAVRVEVIDRGAGFTAAPR